MWSHLHSMSVFLESLYIARRTNADDLRAQLHRLPVSYCIDYKNALIMYKALKFGQPRYHADCWSTGTQVLATRSEGQSRLHQLVPNSQPSSRDFRYAAPSIWNLLPPDLRIKETVPAFKTGLNTQYYMFLQDYQTMDTRSVVKQPPSLRAY